MPNMTRHLRPWLTDRALAEMGGEFEGIVACVSEEYIRNRFTAQRSLEVVITFDDGHRLIPNKTVLQKVITWFGAESDDWIGRRVRIYRRQVEVPNAKGELRTRWQRDIVVESDARYTRAALRSPAAYPVSDRSGRVNGTSTAAPTDEDIPWKGTSQ
jgi:hypothetical protein